MTDLLLPSHHNGFARYAGESDHPNRWKGLVGAWVPELGNTGGILFDMSGYGNHGILTGFTLVNAWVMGRNLRFPGSGLNYDGANGNTRTTAAVQDLAPAAGTIIWWQYPTLAFNDGTIHEIWGMRTSSGNPEFSAQKFSDGNLYIGFNDDGDDDRVVLASSADNYPVNTWSQYALTWVNGATTTLYHNAVKIGDNGGGTTVNSPSDAGIVFGKSGASTGDEFTGRMGLFLFFNRDFNQNELRAHYNYPLRLFVLQPPVVAKAVAAPAGGLSIPLIMGLHDHYSGGLAGGLHG